jgi:hypothetical protein
MPYTVPYKQVILTVTYREADIIVYAVNSFIRREINTERLRNNSCLVQCKSASLHVENPGRP